MKKVLCLFILIMLPFMVFADSAGPNIIGYDAIISNKNGAKVIDTNKVIPYNTKIYVYNEYSNDNGTVVQFCISSNIKQDEGCYGQDGQISIKDIVPLKEELIPTDKDAKDDNSNIVKLKDRKIIVFEKDGIKLRKGPSEAYKETESIIPYHVTVNPKYAILNYEGESSFYTWYYISTDEYQGWLHPSEFHTAILMEEALIATNTNVYDSNNSIVGTIKTEEILNNLYYLENNDKYAYYLEYNNADGFIKNLDFGYKLDNAKIYTVKDTNITSIDGVKRQKVPVATTLNVLYGHEFGEIDGIYINEKNGYFYVEYNGVKGFISTNDVLPLYSNNKRTMVLNYDVEMYDYPSQKANKINKIVPSGTQITTPYHYSETIWTNDEGRDYDWYLITYDGITGWVMTKNSSQHVDPPKDNPSKTNVNKPTVNNTLKHSDNTLLYCLIGAGILCLTATILIILINKKKHRKEDIVKDKIIKEKKNVQDNKNIEEKNDAKKEA